MKNQTARMASRVIFAFGILSVIANTLISSTDWVSDHGYLGLLAYFSGVPVAFLHYSGLSTDADSTPSIVFVSAIIISFSVGFAIWSDQILVACSLEGSRLFTLTLVLLCCLNLALSYFGALFRLPDMFGGERSGSFGGDNSSAGYVIAASQLIATIAHFLIWQYRDQLRFGRSGRT